MKHKLLPYSALLPALAAVPSLAQGQTLEKPNIIMFLVDDMGWQDTSVPFFGNEKSLLNQRYHTPNMEKLAAMGVKFVNAYSCSISSPSRCSLMSGMNAARHRVTNWTLAKNTNTDNTSSVISTPSWNYNGIQPATSTLNNATPITSLPQILKNNGYYTIHCGKAHFGAISTDGADPSTMGFDANIAGAANGGPGSYLASANFKGNDSRFDVIGLEQYWGTDKFLTECLTLEAEKRIDTALAKKKPFYLYMSQYAVHAPYSKDTRFYDNYNGKSDAALTYLNTGTAATINSSEACYDALVEGMDKSLGDLMQYITDKNIAGNTIILFMSDNGGQPLSPRQGQNYTQNLPARGGKGSAFVGGVREPMMAYVPGITKAGTVNTNPVMIEDFYSTILDMAGVKNPTTVQTVDGKSFYDLLKDPSIKRDRTIYWHFPNLWGESVDKEYGYGATSAILDGKYHLIYTWETQRLRLYDVSTDIHENVDLASRMPKKTAELAKKLGDYLRSVNAQRPSLKATGALIDWPDVAGKPDDNSLPCTVSTASIDATATTWPAAGMAWHTMKLRDNYCAYDKTTSDVTVTTTAVGTTPADELLWAFEGNDSTGYKIYNKAAGPGKVLWTALRTADSSDPVKMTAISSTDSVNWSMANSTGGWNIVRKGSVDNFLNKRNNKIGTWINVKAQGEAGSQIILNLVSNTNPTDPTTPTTVVSVDDSLRAAKGDVLKATEVVAGKMVLISTIATGGASYSTGTTQTSGNCLNGVTGKTSDLTPTFDNVMLLEEADKTAGSFYIRSASTGKYIGKSTEANRNLVMQDDKSTALAFVINTPATTTNQTGYVEGTTVNFVTADTKSATDGGIRLNCEMPNVMAGVRTGTGAFSYWNVYAVNVSIPFASTGSYATLSLPFDAKVAEGNTGVLKFYTGKTATGNTALQTTEVGSGNTLTLKAGDAILMKGSNVAMITPATETATALTDNALMATSAAAITTPANAYTLGTLNSVAGFYPCKTASISAHKAYLVVANGAAGYTLGTPTAISSTTTARPVATYDLLGKRTKAQKGILIQSGKKVMK